MVPRVQFRAKAPLTVSQLKTCVSMTEQKRSKTKKQKPHSFRCEVAISFRSLITVLILLSNYTTINHPLRSPLRRNRAGLRAMDAFVIKFMTASFYYFLRLAYKTLEGNRTSRKRRVAGERDKHLSRTLQRTDQTLPWLICSFVIHG